MAGNTSRGSGPGSRQHTTISRLAAGLDRLAGGRIGRQIEGAVQRLFALKEFKEFREVPAIPPPPMAVQDQDPGVQRARMALAHARTQMPGLLSENGPARPPVPGVFPGAGRGLDALTPKASVPAFELSAGTGGLARLEEAILRLEDERRQLSAEVAALRLAVGELRETLLQLDEREPYPRPAAPIEMGEREGERAPAPSEGALEHIAPILPPEPELAALPDPDAVGLIYPSGSVGACLRVASVAGPAALDAIHGALTSLIQVDAVRLLSYADGLAEFRVYLQTAARAREPRDGHHRGRTSGRDQRRGLSMRVENVRAE